MIHKQREAIESLLSDAVTCSEAGDHLGAVASMEHAKVLMQELYYEIWHKHHTSGTGGRK